MGVPFEVRRTAKEKDDLVGLGALAQCLFDEGELEEARGVFVEALARTAAPPETPKHLRRAYAHYAASYATLLEKLGDLDGAEAALKRGLAAEPNCPYGLGAYPQLLTTARRDHDTIEKAYERALAAQKAHPEAVVSVMVKYGNFLRHHLRDAVRSEEMLRRAVRYDGDHAEALASLAVLVHALRPADPEVEVLYKRALDADPLGVNTMSNFGLFLSEVKNDYRAAETTYDRALALDPAHANTAYNYAVLLDAALHDVPKAAAMYDRCLAAQPTHAYALYNLAVVCEEKLTDLPRALGLYRCAVDAAPDDPMATADLGRFLAQKALRDNTNPTTAKNKAPPSKKNGDINVAEAEDLLERALQLDPDSNCFFKATAHAALGEIRLFEGHRDQALKRLKLATASDATNSAVKRLAQLLKDRKRSF